MIVYIIFFFIIKKYIDIIKFVQKKNSLYLAFLHRHGMGQCAYFSIFERVYIIFTIFGDNFIFLIANRLEDYVII